MASVYDRTDIYDLFDSPKKDAQTLSHWQTVFDGRPSTVSRAAQNKYIQFQGRIIPVRSFFTTAIRPDAAVSSHAVKQRLQSLIRAEDPAAPLSDEALRLTLSALGIEVSRRAVAKYRAEMGIPSSSQRKKR